MDNKKILVMLSTNYAGVYCDYNGYLVLETIDEDSCCVGGSDEIKMNFNPLDENYSDNISVGCNYCDNKKQLLCDDDSICYIDGNLLVLKNPYGLDNQKINRCPMCGKKL